MKKTVYVPVIALALAAAGCGNQQAGERQGGILMENLDTTAHPRDDFYQYACGGWMKLHPLTSEYARFGTMDLLNENNQKQIRGLIEELAAKPQAEGSVAQKIGTLYNMAMDSARLNADGIQPIRADLDRVAAVTDRAELSALVATMRRTGYGPFFGIYVGADEMNSSMNIAVAYQGGFSLGQREYYIDNDEHTRDIRAKYQAHVARMFTLAGWDAQQAQQAAKDVLAIETRLARAAKSAVDLRNPYDNYNKMTVADLQRQAPGGEGHDLQRRPGAEGQALLDGRRAGGALAARGRGRVEDDHRPPRLRRLRSLPHRDRRRLAGRPARAQGAHRGGISERQGAV